MSSLNNQFDDMIKFVDRELTDLKTAHLRPLGALDFFHLAQTVSVSLQQIGGVSYYKDFWVDVTIKQPDALPPIVQIGWNIPDGFGWMDLYDFSVSSDYTRWSYQMALTSPDRDSARFLVSAVSSVPIVSIQIRS